MKLTPHNIPPPNRKFLGSGEQMTNSLVSTFRGNIAHFYTFFSVSITATIRANLASRCFRGSHCFLSYVSLQSVF